MKNTKIVNASAKMCAEEAGYWKAGAGVGAAAGVRVILRVGVGVKAGLGVAQAAGAIVVRSRNAARALLAHNGEYE